MLSIGDADADSLDIESNRRRAARLQAQMPALVAHTWRLRKGEDIIHPKPEHALAQGFLYMLEGKEPDQARVDGLNAYMVAVSEHRGNVGKCLSLLLPRQARLRALAAVSQLHADGVSRAAAVAAVGKDESLRGDGRCHRPQRHAIESPFILPVPSAGSGPIAGDSPGAGHDKLRLFSLSFHEQG